MTLFALGLSYKGELLLVFEFAVFSGRFKFFVSSRHRIIPFCRPFLKPNISEVSS
jgi:hypothetical protein